MAEEDHSSTINGEDDYFSEERLDYDLTSSISSEINTPGMRPTLTSAGGISPHRVRSLRDQESQLQELKKENFGLKLRIYHLEEALRRRHGDTNEDWEMNIQLNVQVDEMKQEMADRESLLRDAKNAIDALENKAKELERELSEANRSLSTIHQLQDTVRELQQEVQEYQLSLNEAQRRAAEEKARADDLDNEIVELQEKMSNMEPIIQVPVKKTASVKVQTIEPVFDELKGLGEELERVKREWEESKESCDIKDKRIQELEMEVLRVSNRMAAMATDHAQQMQTLTDEINQLKVQLEEKNDVIQKRDNEIIELNRQIRELQRQLREETDTNNHLKNKLRTAEEENEEKERENEELRKKIRDLKDEVDKLNIKITGQERMLRDKDDEIENLKRLLRQKEAEIDGLKRSLGQVKAELAEKDKSLMAARTAAHSTNISSQEISYQVTQLRGEIERLEEQLTQETHLKEKAEAECLGKDELITQLRQNLKSTQTRLTDTENRLLEATTAHAADKGMLQGTIEDLNRQLEQKEAAARSLRSDISQLRGENDALRRELERMRGEFISLQSRIDELEQKIKEKDLLLEHSQATIGSLQNVLDELSNDKNKDTASAAELARLQLLLQAQEEAMKSKESEINNLRLAVGTKDEIIQELNNRLIKSQNEKQKLEEAVLLLIEEKEQLKTRISELEDNNDLSEAKRIMEELQEQVKLLEEQIREMSASPRKVISVETTPTKEQGSPSSSSTTMIIGGMSEKLLLLILQKLDELYREILTGRSEGTQANSSLSSKLDDLAKLQKQLKSLFRKRKEGEDEEDYGTRRIELDELQETSERIIKELERERERMQAEGEEREIMLTQLKSELMDAKRGLMDSQLTSERQEEELNRLRGEIRRLRLLIEEEEGKSRKLRIELMESRLSNLRNLPTHHDEGVGSVTSLPDLHRDGRGQERWTTSSYTLGGDRPDLSEVIEKHREATRLNKELQKKCEERLNSSKPSDRNNSSGYWERRVKETEATARREKREQEKLYNTRIRILEEKLRDSEKKRTILEEQLMSAVQKEEEIESLVTSLQSADEKKRLLELKLEQILTEKNNQISELEQRIMELQEHQGMYSPVTDGELRNLRKTISSLRSEKTLLLSQLNTCRDQVIALQTEIEQHHCSTGASPAYRRSLSIEALLEQIKQLRRQLEMSLDNNSSLHDILINASQVLDSSQRQRTTTTTGATGHHVLSPCTSPPLVNSFVPGAASTANPGRTRQRMNTSYQLEERIRRALDSPNCGFMDKEFLRELLLYLQQQRRQLDDSQRLLDDLQNQEIPSVTHITVTGRVGEAGDGADDIDDTRTSSRASSVDLSVLHEQVKRTHEAIKESKKILKNHHHQQPLS